MSGVTQQMMFGGAGAAAATCVTSSTNATALFHADGSNGSTTFTDDGVGANAPHTVAAVGTFALSTAQKVFGTASFNPAGTVNYGTLVSAADIQFGTGDFTVDFWFYSDDASNVALFGNNADGIGDTGFIIFIGGGGTLGMNTNATAVVASVAGVSVNTWYHAALTRNGGNFYLGLDGVMASASDGSFNFSTVTNYGIGKDFQTGGGKPTLNGYIDELRIIKGTAYWTANFTPPSLPWCN